MANRVKVTLKKKGRSIPKIQRDFNEALENSLERLAKNVEQRARLNASIDTGALRASINALPVDKVGEVYSVSVEATAVYAFKVHEFHEPSDTALFGPGPRTQAQPGTPEGGAGGKFLERVVTKNAVAYRKYVALSLDAALRKKPNRGKLP